MDFLQNFHLGISLTIQALYLFYLNMACFHMCMYVHSFDHSVLQLCIIRFIGKSACLC